MTISDEISIIANKLANQGITPSVALVKSKLSSPTPLPQIISTLKNWQHEPEFIEQKTKDIDINAQDEHEKQTIQPEALEKIIASAISPLRQEIREMKLLLNELIQQRNKN